MSAAPVAHTGRSHAKLSPSGAHRWIECPGSINACEGLTSTSSHFADEGTAAHEVCEQALLRNLDADAFLGSWVDIDTGKFWPVEPQGVDESDKVFEVTDEMVEAVQVYVDYCRPLCEGAEVEIEAKLDLDHIPGMEFGTGDFCAYHPETQTLTIVDFKYGMGVKVHAKENPQLLTYALGVARRYAGRGVKSVKIVVIQPRAQGVPVDEWETDALGLLDFEADLTAAALATVPADAPRHAGEHCKFCLAAPTCKTLQGLAMSTALATFEPVDEVTEADLAPVERMSSDDLAKALRGVPVMKLWLKRMEEFAHAEAMAGRIPTGFKLVPKRASRKWKDPKEAEKFLFYSMGLGDGAFTKKLITPAGADKILKGRKSDAEPFYEKISSGTNLVPNEDERAPARPEIAETFQALFE
jgi:hypothetical protein